MKPSTVIDIIDCAHLSKSVECPYPQRGGIMLVAPPSALKSTMIEIALAEYPNTLSLTDLNINTMVKLRNDLTSNRYASIGFGEFEKLYQRHSTTASNIEGSIKALVEEGFKRASFEDVRMGGIKARCMIVGGMTPDFYSQKYNSWQQSGFARRFLWSMFSVQNPELILEAIHEMKKLNIDHIRRRHPGMKTIPMNLTETESRWLMRLVREQPGQSTPYVLLKKLYAVLKWKYDNDPKKPKTVMEDFAPSLERDGAELILPKEME